MQGAFGRPTVATHYGEGHFPLGDGSILFVREVILFEGVRDTLLSYVKLVDDGHQIVVKGADDSVFIERREGFIIRLNKTDNILTLGDPVEKEAMKMLNIVTRSMQRQIDPGLMETEDEPNTSTQTNFNQTQPHTDTPDLIIPFVPPSAPDIDPPSIISPLSMLAHVRYGHIGGRKLDQLILHNAADGLVLKQKYAAHKQLIDNCDACMLAKARSKFFGTCINHAAKLPNDKAVGDVIGPITVVHKEKTENDSILTHTKHYISVITDVFSRHVSIMVLDEKRPSDHVILYATTSRVTTSKELLHFHTDGGKEYNRAERDLKAKGVKITRTPPYTPQWNGIAERKNRTLIEMARAMLLHAGLDPNFFWSYAIETAVYTHNRVNVVEKKNKTPHELFTGHKPDVSRFRTFGCDAIVTLPKPHQGNKMDARGEKGIFIGYDMKHEGSWRIWVPTGDPGTGRGDVRITCHAVMFDAEFKMAKEQTQIANVSNSITNKLNTGTRVSDNAIYNDNSTLQQRIDACLPFQSNELDHDANSIELNGDEINLEREADGREEERSDPHDDEDMMTDSSEKQKDRSNRSQQHCRNNNNNNNNNSHQAINKDKEITDESDEDPEFNLDKATARKIAAAEAKEAEKSSFQQQERRRSTRMIKERKLGGLNPEDFGPGSFTISTVSAIVSPDNLIRANEVRIPANSRQANRDNKFASFWAAARESEMKSLNEHGHGN